MTNPMTRRSKKRLDPGARDRLRAEIARIDAEAALRIERDLRHAMRPDPAELAALAEDIPVAAPLPSQEAPPSGLVADPPSPMFINGSAERRPRRFDLPRVVDVWDNLSSLPVDQSAMARNLVITAARTDPAHGAFDVLRTRLVQALAANGWTRVGITSPTKGCGKSFAAINLAITLSRYDNCRTVLMDMDLRHPAIADYLGIRTQAAMGDFLRSQVPAEGFLRRMGPNPLKIGPNLAIGLNARPEDYAAELFHEDTTTEALLRMHEALSPDVVLFDLPPTLAQDDVIAFRPHLDCVLLVAGGGLTTAREMKETVRRLGEDKPVVGVILNKAEGEGINEYSY
jgi:protein-tyrosine kinase